MVKRTARFGYKSGILPKPRDILPPLKTSWEKEAEAKVKVGFTDPDMVPKGVPQKPIPKRQKFAQERMAHSAKSKKNASKKNTSETAEWKNLTAEMRRKYFIDAHITQQRVNNRELENRERKFQQAKEARLKTDTSEQTKATKFTLPTIEALLTGPFVKHRTRQEAEELKLKRAANRKIHELRHNEQQAENVLELYQQAESFIVNEQQLSEALKKEFSLEQSKPRYGPPSTLLGSEVYGQSVRNSAEGNLARAMLGVTSNNKPGLPEVNEALEEKSKLWDDFRQDK